MPKNPIKKIALVLIITFMFVVPIYWVLNNKKTNQKSVVENRNLYTFPKLLVFNHSDQNSEILQIDFRQTIKQLVGRKFQQEFELAVYDQFPLREELITLSKTWDLLAINLAYLPLNDDYMPADMASELYINKKADFLVPAPLEFNQEVRTSIDYRIENYEYLINSYPSINFSAFCIEKLDAAAIYSLNEYFPDADAGQSLAYFIKKKPSNLNFEVMPLTSLDEYSTNFYRTDHHWNHIGYLNGYHQIYELLKRSYPDISPAITTSGYLPTGKLEYYGSYARRSLYPISPDPFLVPAFQFTHFIFRRDGEEGSLYPMKTPSKKKYTEYYAKYFGNNPGLREFEVNNNSNRKLLIIGSSYAEPIAPVIAQHFAKTFYVDLRKYHDFSFKKFVRSHPITDMIIIGGSKEIYRDTNDWIIPAIKNN